MLTRRGVSRPRPRPRSKASRPRPRPEVSRPRPRPRPEIKAKIELNSYGAMAVPMTLVYQCTVSVIIPWYTVFGRILVTLTLALALNEAKAKARNTRPRPRPKASRPRPEVSRPRPRPRPRPENLASRPRPRPNNPGHSSCTEPRSSFYQFVTPLHGFSCYISDSSRYCTTRIIHIIHYSKDTHCTLTYSIYSYAYPRAMKESNVVTFA